MLSLEASLTCFLVRVFSNCYSQPLSFDPFLKLMVPFALKFMHMLRNSVIRGTVSTKEIFIAA